MWRNRLIDAALLVGVLLACALSILIRHWTYESGYNSRPTLLISLLGFALVLSIVGLVISAFVHLLVSLRLGRKEPRRILERSVMCLLVYAAAAVVAVVLIYESPLEVFTRGFRDRVRDDVNLPALRQWQQAQALLPAPPDSMLPNAALPADVRRLQPEMAFRYPDDSVYIYWGGGFGHWGVAVAPQDATPPSTDAFYVSMQVSPGIYVWHDRQ